MTELFSSDYIKSELKEKKWIKFRPLEIDDFQKWFCSVLSELTSCETDEQKFKEIFNKMYEINQIEPQYFIAVWEDIQNWKITVAWSVIIEKKFIHDWKSVWHIEDIVVSSKYRGLWLGEHLISILKDISNESCYKVILDCDKKNLWFYDKCWFSEKSLWMAKYL
jgi:glucosamine-phosphate N-acetyltransferase